MLTPNCVNPVTPLLLVDSIQIYISVKYLNKTKRGCVIQPLFLKVFNVVVRVSVN